MLHLKVASANNKRKREVKMKKINKIWLNIAVIAIVGLVVFGCVNDINITGSNPCVICDVDPCVCQIGISCVTCGEDLCVCLTNTPCVICSEDPCVCDESDPPIINKNIEDWELYTLILDMKQEIEDYGFTQPADEDFLEADEIFNTAIDAYMADEDEAAALGEEAKNLFESILKNGWIAYLAPIKTAAATERELAVAERANIASRDLFRNADALYNQADTDYENENFKVAAQGYIEAKKGFTSARDDTESKRLRAEEAIRIAECTIGGGHYFTLWQQTTAPTCTTAAIETEKCSGCTVLGTETRSGAPALGHSENCGH